MVNKIYHTFFKQNSFSRLNSKLPLNILCKGGVSNFYNFKNAIVKPAVSQKSMPDFQDCAPWLRS